MGEPRGRGRGPQGCSRACLSHLRPEAAARGRARASFAAVPWSKAGSLRRSAGGLEVQVPLRRLLVFGFVLVLALFLVEERGLAGDGGRLVIGRRHFLAVDLDR